MASKGAPDNSGRCAVAEGGSLGPVTCEKPHPARSNTAPPSIIMVMPLPCKGSCASLRHASTTNGVSSIAFSAEVMRCCKPVK